MHFLLVLVICLAFYPDSAANIGKPLLNGGLTWLGVAILALGTEVVARLLARRLQRRPERRSAIVRWYGWCRMFHGAMNVGLYLAILFVLRWGSVVRDDMGLRNMILLDELLVAAPFLFLLVSAWFSFYQVERALHAGTTIPASTDFCTRREYLGFRIRHYLGLVLAPILIFTGVHEAVLWFFPALNAQLGFASLAFVTIAVVLFTPWLLKVIWNAQPLPAGPLRDRLTATARRLRFRYSDILLWNTQRGIANAMVTGILPIPRYVLLSDSLVSDLQPEEIEAVFGHEMGHVKHHHMPLYLSFLVLSLMLITGILMQLSDVDWAQILGSGPVPHRLWSTPLAALGFLGGYIWLVFGFLSRRCERQADVYGCKAVSCASSECNEHEEPALATKTSVALSPTGIQTFIQALEKVADLNGIRRDKPSWRHSSIARRVAFLERIRAEPSLEPAFQKRLLIVKWAMFLILVAALGVFAIWF